MTTPVLWADPAVVTTYLGSDAPAAGDTEGQARLNDSCVSATEILYGLSGRQFPGIIAVTGCRPTSRPEQVTDFVWASSLRRMYGWGWGYSSNWLWGTCVGCQYSGCCSPYMIGLGRSPLVSIEQVTIDGTALASTAYRIDDAKWLARQDGHGWPTCQNLGAPLADKNTFGIDFTFGQDPPQSGKDAATVLSAEWYKGLTPALAGSCALPKRVSSISRQGVTLAVLDPMAYIQKGYTGIASVDMFIKAANPKGWVRKPMVYSPDTVNIARRQTWP